MGIFNFNEFERAGKEDTPQFAAAAAKEAQLENEATARANSLRSQNIQGGVALYNAGMGDKSPIYDYIAGKFPGAETASAVPTVAAAPTTGAGLGGSFAGGGTGVGSSGAASMSMAPGASAPVMGLGGGGGLGAGGSGLPITGGGSTAIGTGSTAIGGAGVMSSVATAMPYVAAALAADQALNDGKATDHIYGMINDLDEPKEWDNLFEDYMMGFTGKGWLWS